MMKNTIVLLVVLLMVAQTAFAETKKSSQATVFYLLNSWKAEVDSEPVQTLKEVVFGLSAALQTSERFLFELDGTMANANLDPEVEGAEDLSLSSLNDTRIAATFFSSAGLTSLTAMANLPTGKTKLDEEQYIIASSVADNSRKYLVRRFGQGLDLGAQGMVHPKAGNLAFHLGAGYMLKGKFQARENDTEKYKFGDEISAMAGFGYQKDKIAFMADGSYTMYMKDKVGDAEVFQAGAAMVIRGSVSYTDVVNFTTGVAVLTRGKGKVQDASAGSELVDEAERSGRNEFLWYGGVGYPVMEKLRVNGRLEYQNFSENDYGKDTPLYRPKSNYFGIGGGGSYAFTPNFFASTMVTLYSGKVDISDNYETDLSGLGLIFALTYRVM
ncbi:MAG: hypothetical protein IPH59_08515 [bacterium]|nr:hypothetical protein [bacterium]